MTTTKEKKQPDPGSMTFSRMTSFLTCERKEWYQYRAGGCGVESIKPEIYFLEGDFLHHTLAMFYKNGSMLRVNMVKRIEAMLEDMGAMDPSELDDYTVRMHAMIGAAHGYKAQYKADLANFEVLAIEQPFKVELAGQTWEGRIDLAVKHKEWGTCGFFEHKALSQVSVANYSSLPLNLQQLIYCVGYKEVTGEWPTWYVWNIVRKSQLRRKGMKPAKGKAVAEPERMDEFEIRVMQQYIEEPEKMFLRTPPRVVEESALKSLENDLAIHQDTWRAYCNNDRTPPMRYSSCMGMYGNVCEFAPACQALALGHKEGWNAPECQGFFRKKKVLHTELVEGKEDKE